MKNRSTRNGINDGMKTTAREQAQIAAWQNIMTGRRPQRSAKYGITNAPTVIPITSIVCERAANALFSQTKSHCNEDGKKIMLFFMRKLEESEEENRH